jgi:hypothetical protein
MFCDHCSMFHTEVDVHMFCKVKHFKMQQHVQSPVSTNHHYTSNWDEVTDLFIINVYGFLCL